MERFNLQDFKGGWFLGNFSPAVYKTVDFEVSVKYFNAGDSEKAHFQKVASEITVVIAGVISLNEKKFSANDIVIIEPNEVAEFVSISESILVCIKFPSIPSDKIIIHE